MSHVYFSYTAGIYLFVLYKVISCINAFQPHTISKINDFHSPKTVPCVSLLSYTPWDCKLWLRRSLDADDLGDRFCRDLFLKLLVTLGIPLTLRWRQESLDGGQQAICISLARPSCYQVERYHSAATYRHLRLSLPHFPGEREQKRRRGEGGDRCEWAKVGANVWSPRYNVPRNDQENFRSDKTAQHKTFLFLPMSCCFARPNGTNSEQTSQPTSEGEKEKRIPRPAPTLRLRSRCAALHIITTTGNQKGSHRALRVPSFRAKVQAKQQELL